MHRRFAQLLADCADLTLSVLFGSGGTLLPYYLDEEHNWALDMANLKSQVEAARADGKSVRAPGS